MRSRINELYKKRELTHITFNGDMLYDVPGVSPHPFVIHVESGRNRIKFFRICSVCSAPMLQRAIHVDGKPVCSKECKYENNSRTFNLGLSRRRYDGFRKKKYANHVVRNELDRGRLVRPSFCSACQKETFVEAHHKDYDKPLDIEWLCMSCHRQLHIA